LPASGPSATKLRARRRGLDRPGREAGAGFDRVSWEFAVRHPDLVSAWARDGGSLRFLAAADELALCWLLADAGRDGYQAVPFCEPDLGNALTAVAVYGAARLCSRYPLAMRGGENTR
jgi:hypothetical protein